MPKPTFIFRIKLKNNKRIYRDIEIIQNASLSTLAVKIIDAFGFYFDHCYGFYSKITGNISDSKELYELFTDIDDVEPSPNAKSVEKTRLKSVFQVGKIMLFLFDYGDNWEFLVECTDINESNKPSFKSKILAKKGKAPEQYPDCED